jgi:hypothetical protein
MHLQALNCNKSYLEEGLPLSLTSMDIMEYKRRYCSFYCSKQDYLGELGFDGFK